MTILFVDVDGVLHRDVPAPDREVFERVHLLWEILRACPSVEVVISSSWRDQYPFEEIIDFLTANGGEELAHRIIGCTPKVPKEDRDDYRRREIECLAWLAENRPDAQWLAIDDIAYWFTFDSPNLHLVDYVTGLTDADVEAVVEKIRKLEAKRDSVR